MLFTLSVVPYCPAPLALPRTVVWLAAYNVTLGASRLRPLDCTLMFILAALLLGAVKVKYSTWPAVVMSRLLTTAVRLVELMAEVMLLAVEKLPLPLPAVL